MKTSEVTQHTTSRLPWLNPTRLGLIGYFFVGSAMVLFPSIMPTVINDLNLSLATAGSVFPAMAVGSLVGGFLAGGAGDWVGRRTVLTISALLFAVGLLVAAFAGSWLPLLLGLCVVGFGRGALSTSINASTATIEPTQRGRALNFLHGVYSAGAAISPILIGVLLGYVMGWRDVLVGSALVWLAFALLSLWVYEPERTQRQDGKPSFSLRIFQKRLFLLAFIAAFFYNGVAWSLLGWVNVYAQDLGRLSPLLSTGMISLFYIALTGGRFACGHMSERFGYAKTLLWCAGGTAIVYPLLFLGGAIEVVAVGICLSGVFISGVYPTALAYSNRLFPEVAGMVTGTMSVAMTLGTMVPPWWTGVVAENWSFPVALGLNYAMVVGLLWVSLSMLRGERVRPEE